jgi:hypothetical protein
VLFNFYIVMVMFFLVDEISSVITEYLQRDATVDGNPFLRFGKTLVAHVTDDLYNVLDLVSYAFSWLTIRSWIYFDGDPFRQIFYFEEMPEWETKKCATQPDGYSDVCSDADVVQRFFLMANLFRTFVRFGSGNCIIICVRMLKFLRQDPRMKVIVGTLGNTIRRVVCFICMLFIVFVAFVSMAYLSFGMEVGDFSELYGSGKKCFIMVIGNFDFEELNGVDYYMSRAFFFPFMIAFYFVLMNIFLAIIDKSFQENAESYEEMAKIKRKEGVGQKAQRGVLFRVIKTGFVMMRGLKKKAGAFSDDKASMHGKKLHHAAHDSLVHDHRHAVVTDSAYIHAPALRHAVEKRATISRTGAAAIDAAAAESWALMPDEIKDWSVEVFKELYEDLSRWDRERKECNTSEELEEMFLRMRAELNQRLAGLHEGIKTAEENNRATVLYNLEQTVKDQDVLCAHIMKLQQELERTESLQGENDDTYKRLRDAASALVLGREEVEANED